MIFNLGGTGGDGLNFEVVQYTSTPTGTAKENTIGVVTDTAITGWKMQAEQPTAAAGLVWISTGINSEVPFYVDKENYLKIYPKSVSQYVNGAWTSPDAYIYQSGEWVFFSSSALYLINYENDNATVTGGYTARGWKVDSDGKTYTPSYTIDSSGLTVVGIGIWQQGVVEIVNDIDLTNYNTLNFIMTAKQNTNNMYEGYLEWAQIAVYNRLAGTYSSGVKAYKPVCSCNLNEITSISVENLNGSFGIGHFVRTNQNAESNPIGWTVSQMWLE